MSEMTSTGQEPNIPASIQEIAGRIQSMDHFSPSLVRNVLREVEVSRDDLIPYERFDHDPADSYGRTMVYDGGFFEIMVMSWLPGDFSAIHDHGFTQWGAVRVYGEAEHATYLVQDGTITTLSRMTMKSGQVTAVGHQLVHQMGNNGDERYVSLHVYGNYERDEKITADARVFDLAEGKIQRNDGGAFFALPESAIKRREPAPSPDYLTWLRHQTELIHRVAKAQNSQQEQSVHDLEALRAALFDTANYPQLLEDLKEHLNESGHTTDGNYWKLLTNELQQAAALQQDILGVKKKSDRFQDYAFMYDEVIGKPCLHSFMKRYLQFFSDTYSVNLTQQQILSIGCGTGLVERYMIENMGVPYSNLLGFDYSESMVKVAAQHINAEWGDALELDPKVGTWDVAFCGLNVFQYIGHARLEEAVHKVGSVVNEGGYFIGDFITPDHIRWYPNAIFSEDESIVTLRTPQLIEKENYMYMRSSILNIRTDQGKLQISYAGAHERFLPPLSRIRKYFEQAFAQVDIYDALHCTLIEPGRDTCPSTRYVVVAKK